LWDSSRPARAGAGARVERSRGGRVPQALVEAAQAAGRTNDTYLAAQYRRLAAQRDKKKAVVAVGHTIVVIAYHLLAGDRDYQELGAGWFDEHDRAAVQRRLVRRLEALGWGRPVAASRRLIATPHPRRAEILFRPDQLIPHGAVRLRHSGMQQRRGRDHQHVSRVGPWPA